MLKTRTLLHLSAAFTLSFFATVALAGRFKVAVLAMWTASGMKFFGMIDLVWPKRRTVRAMMAARSVYCMN